MTLEELFDDVLLRRLSPESHFKRDRITVTRGAFRAPGGYDRQISVQVSDCSNHPAFRHKSSTTRSGIGVSENSSFAT